MDQAVAEVLAEYEARAQSEQAKLRDLSAGIGQHSIDDLLLPVGPDSGAFMNLLIRVGECRSILEVGTSYGYSTLWLAAAAREVGGRVTTLEIHPGKVEYARSRLGKAGLAAHVDFRLGPAQNTLESLPGPFDFVLLDLWKDLYVPCFDLFYPKLARGAVIVADNMLYPEATLPAAAHYRRHVRKAPGISSVLLPVGSGLEVSRFAADP